MSSSQTPGEGVYQQEGEVIVVLPGADKYVVIQQTPIGVTTQQISILQNATSEVVEPKPVSAYLTPYLNYWRNFVTDYKPNQHWLRFQERWRSLDKDVAYCVTQFKKEYVLPIGDIPVRSVCMAVSTGLTYAVFGRINQRFLGRTRNLALSFAINGLFWVPEMFNPFLFCRTRA